jgi:hypothetical protein
VDKLKASGGTDSETAGDLVVKEEL